MCCLANLRLTILKLGSVYSEESFSFTFISAFLYRARCFIYRFTEIYIYLFAFASDLHLESNRLIFFSCRNTLSAFR